MSYENKNIQDLPAQFPDKYPVPEDQTVTEATLRENINQGFSDHEAALDRNLSNIKRYSGDGGSVDLMLRVPSSPDDNTGDPAVIAGELPLETVAIVGGVYALTGAEKVEDEQSKDPHIGRKILRRGFYEDKPVYFSEQVRIAGPSDRYAEEGESVFEVMVMSESVADRTRHQARNNALAQAALGIDFSAENK